MTLSPFAKKLLFARQLKIGIKDEVIGFRKVMIDPEVLKGVDLYESFKAELRERIRMLGLSGDTLIGFSFNLLETYGFGKFELVEKGEKIVVEVEDSPFVSKPSDEPQCKPICDCLKALFEFILGRECEVDEVACAAMGQKRCRFLIR